jgi:hypothetical protein
MEALAKANRIRLQMAEARRAIERGDTAAVDFFEIELHGHMTVARVLSAQRRWGAQRTRKFLATVPLARGRNLENVKIFDLTKRERDALTAAIVEHTAASGRNGHKTTEGDSQDG